MNKKLLLVSIAGAGLGYLYLKTRTVIAQSSYNYTIYKNGDYTIGYNNKTKKEEFRNLDFSTLTQSVVDKLLVESYVNSGGNIFNILIKDGIYVAKQPITIPITPNSTPNPNVTFNVSGESLNTKIKLDATSINNFPHKYVFQAFSPGTYQKLFIDGSYREMVNQPQDNGGLLYIGADNIIVQDCLFNDSNYFKIFSYYGQNNILIQRNKFEGAAGNDNIGGGRFNNLIVDNNIFNTTTSKWYAGTSLDTVGASNITFANNTTNTDIYLMMEGTNGAVIRNNTFNSVESNVFIQSDKYYNLATPIENSKNIKVIDNQFTRGSYVIIKSNYASGKTATECRDFEVSGNAFNGPQHTAIITVQDNNANKVNNVLIKNNTITDNNSLGDATWNTGMGIIEPSGINIAHGEYIILENNTIKDNRTIKRSIYGIQIGDVYDPNRYMSANHITIRNNTIAGYVKQAINVANPQYSTDVVIS